MKGVIDMALYPRSFSASGLRGILPLDYLISSCLNTGKIKPPGYKAMSIEQYERVHGH